ncbi:MAG: ribokinase [Mahellales bacterium]|jgi:ribokinase
MCKITVVGSLNMDMSLTIPKVPVVGETVIGDGLMVCPGGKGANQAVAAVRLGGKVSMIGCVGNDAHGRSLLNNLSANNVDIDNVKILDDTPSGLAMIGIYNGDNMILVYPGANSRVTPDIIDSNEELIKNSSMLVLQLEIPMETVEYAVKISKKHNVKVLLNPAPAKQLAGELLAGVDIITPNQSECEVITGIKVNNINDAKKAISVIKEMGVGQVIVTMGSQGVVYNNADEIIYKPAHKVKVVDTTAAGDSFNGALAVALSQGKSVDKAIDFANIVGALTVTKKGAQPSLPTIEDVESFSS